MPAAMIHLLTARDYDPDGDARYLLGSIAPDHAFDRAYKDAIHLRDVSDRLKALGELRSRLDLRDSYSLGWLLHLYTDLKWGAIENYHVVLDSGVLGIDKCVEIIASLY